MLTRFTIIFWVLFHIIKPLSAQVTTGELRLLQKLDSISVSATRPAAFAELYLATMINGLRFFENADDSSRAYVRTMQDRFARFFFDAADSFAMQKQVPGSWKRYYADTSGSSIRYMLLGINAHINGDLWQVLTASFSYNELIRIRPLYFSYYYGLLEIYDQVYNEVFQTSRPLRLLHSVSMGIDRWYGKRLLQRWLKRQMKLACTYYSRPRQFRKILARLDRKMDRLDRAIVRHF